MTFSVKAKQLSDSIQTSAAGTALALRFCLVTCLMSDRPDLDDDVTRLQFYKDLLYPDNKYHKEVRLSRIFTDLQRFPGRAINNGRYIVHDPGSPMSIILHLAYKALLVIYCELKAAIAKRFDLGEFLHPNWSEKVLMPPLGVRVPFSSHMNPPLPFSLCCTEMFSSCHLSIMTTPEFIESGTWAGYFCTNWSGGNYGKVKVDHALRDIHFTTTKNEAEANLLNLRSSKVLSGRMGPYHFEGKLWRASGKIDLVQSDGSEDEDKDINIYLQAIMTPFGIVAIRAGGFRRTWMWIWKA